MNSLFLSERRCKCGKLLLKGVFFDGTLEIKCKRCGAINQIGIARVANDQTHYTLIINETGTITNASTSACDILGYGITELIGLNFTKINSTMLQSVGQKVFGAKSLLNTDNYFQLDSAHRTKDGKIIEIDLHLRLYQPTDKQRQLILCAKLKNCVHKSTAKKPTSLQKKQCDFYFDIDQQGMCQYVSPSVAAIFGKSQEAVVGHDIYQFVPKPCWQDAVETFQYFSAIEQPYRVTHCLGADSIGKKIICDLFFAPNFNILGEFVGYCVLGWIKKPEKDPTIHQSDDVQ